MRRLFDSAWLGPLIWTALYISDYYLTLFCACLYRSGVQEKIVHGGSYEITPYYQQDIDSLRSVSPRFLWMLGLSVVTLIAIWRVSKQLAAPDVYSFFLGAMILLELVIHQRHLRNLYLFRAISRPGAARGRIEYARWLTLRRSSVEFFGATGLFVILSIFTWNLFILGGAFGCYLNAMAHWGLARRQVSALPAS